MAAAATAVRKNKERRAQQETDVAAVFARFDADGSGDIDRSELEAALSQLGITASAEEVSRIMAKFDDGTGAGEGTLDIDEFGELVAQIRGGGKASQPNKPSLRKQATKAVVGPIAKPIVKACNPKGKLPYQDAVYAIYNNNIVVWSVAACIVANFLVNIIEKEIDPFGTKMTQTWIDFDLAFNIIFLVELVANIYSCGGPLWNFWKVPWNVFDFVIVAVGVVLMTGIDLGAGNKLKLLRAFRVFRLFKRVPSLNKIIVALIFSLPGVFNAFLIMLIFFCIYAILAVELFIGFGHEDGTYTVYDDSGVGLVNVSNSAITGRGLSVGHEYYGTFMRALYTLFQVFTGESWSEAIARPLLFGLESSSFFVSVYFVSFILITQIVLANVVVAVLLDKFVADPEPSGEPASSAGDLLGGEMMGEAGPDSSNTANSLPAAQPLPPHAAQAKPASPAFARSGAEHATLEAVLDRLNGLGDAMASMQSEMGSMRAELQRLQTGDSGKRLVA